MESESYNVLLMWNLSWYRVMLLQIWLHQYGGGSRESVFESEPSSPKLYLVRNFKFVDSTYKLFSFFTVSIIKMRVE